MKIRFLSLMLVLLIGKFNSQAQQFPTFTNPPDFLKLSYTQAENATESEVEHISSGRKFSPEYVTKLVNQLKYEQLDASNKVLAVFLLGELKPSDTNAVEYLVENIDLRAWIDRRGSMPRWAGFPAQEALWKIGHPAVDPIFQHLTIETNELRRHLMCHVLKVTEGSKKIAENTEIAKGQMERQIANETDPTKKKNLEAALVELDHK